MYFYKEKNLFYDCDVIVQYDDSFTIKDILKKLDESGMGILFFIDEIYKLIGIITDGDVRRALLNDQYKIKNIINTKPFTMNEKASSESVLLKLKEVHRMHMPIVNNENFLVDIAVLDDFAFTLKPNWVVIMAGGLGTRLGKLTKDVPKPMLTVANQPMIKHIMDMFVSHGYTKFMLSVNYKSELIKEYFKDGNEFGVEIKYLEETKRLGTGGALSLIDFKLNAPFFVTNGDVLSSIDYERLLQFHKEENLSATMCVRQENYQVPYGVIKSDEKNNIVDIVEKPSYDFFINTGIYVLSPEVLKYIPKDEFFDLPQLFKILKEKNKNIKSYEMSDYWIDMGKPEDYTIISKKMENLHG